MAKSVETTAKKIAPREMSFEEIKAIMHARWQVPHVELTDLACEGAYDYYLYCLDVHNGVRTGDDAKIKTEISVPYNGTSVTVNMNENGIRLCKTIYGTTQNFLKEVEDADVFKLLNIKDENGQHRIDSFMEFDGQELKVLCFCPGALIFIEQMWDLVDTLTLKEATDSQIVTTTEQRAMLYQVPKIAQQLWQVLKQVGETFVSSVPHAQIERKEPYVNAYTLFKGEIEGQKVTYVRCYCPSSDRTFMLPCDNKATNPRDAVGSLCHIPSEVIQDIHSMSRQGEVYVATYKDGVDTNSAEFKKRLRSIPRPLTGDEYFSKLVYES